MKPKVFGIGAKKSFTVTKKGNIRKGEKEPSIYCVCVVLYIPCSMRRHVFRSFPHNQNQLFLFDNMLSQLLVQLFFFGLGKHQFKKKKVGNVQNSWIQTYKRDIGT